MVQKLLVKWLVAAVRLFQQLVAAVAVEVAAAAAVVAVVAAAAVAVVAAAAVAAVAEAEVVSVDYLSLVLCRGVSCRLSKIIYYLRSSSNKIMVRRVSGSCDVVIWRYLSISFVDSSSSDV